MQYAIRSFADALDAVPLALAENSGLPPIDTLTAVKAQVKVLEFSIPLSCTCLVRLPIVVLSALVWSEAMFFLVLVYGILAVHRYIICKS